MAITICDLCAKRKICIDKNKFYPVVKCQNYHEGEAIKVEQTNEEWFCGLSTAEKAKWLYDHYVNARAEEFYGRPEKTLSEYQKWLVSVHREIDGTKID